MVNLTKFVVRDQCELVGCPLIFAILVGDAEMTKEVAVEQRILPLNQNVVAVDLLRQQSVCNLSKPR